MFSFFSRAMGNDRLVDDDLTGVARGSETLLDGPFEELWIGSWETLGERLLREYSEAAGLDPFFDVLGPAERLASV